MKTPAGIKLAPSLEVTTVSVPLGERNTPTAHSAG